MAKTPASGICYQLLHRAASALIVGEQYRAAAAVFLVHSFSRQRTGWKDYEAFVRLFGVEAAASGVQRLPGGSAIPLFSAWVAGDCVFLKS